MAYKEQNARNSLWFYPRRGTQPALPQCCPCDWGLCVFTLGEIQHERTLNEYSNFGPAHYLPTRVPAASRSAAGTAAESRAPLPHGAAPGTSGRRMRTEDDGGTCGAAVVLPVASQSMAKTADCYLWLLLTQILTVSLRLKSEEPFPWSRRSLFSTLIRTVW
jgi:hypothetical protein